MSITDNPPPPTTKPARQLATVGRIVRYHHAEGEDVYDLAAIVTNVAYIGGTMEEVCLTVFDRVGTTFGTTGVKYDQSGQTDGTWSWPERS